MYDYRVGNGFDVHAFSKDRKLVLGGVKIDYDRGLAGHSDADVLTHAIIDALLGAAGLGDIGRHFPDYDEAYKDISSLILLQKINGIIKKGGWNISNIDSTIIAQKPKLAGYIDEMICNFVKILGVEKDRINIKATTTEKLGFTGREEGIAAFATAALFKEV